MKGGDQITSPETPPWLLPPACAGTVSALPPPRGHPTSGGLSRLRSSSTLSCSPSPTPPLPSLYRNCRTVPTHPAQGQPSCPSRDPTRRLLPLLPQTPARLVPEDPSLLSIRLGSAQALSSCPISRAQARTVVFWARTPAPPTSMTSAFPTPGFPSCPLLGTEPIVMRWPRKVHVPPAASWSWGPGSTAHQAPGRADRHVTCPHVPSSCLRPAGSCPLAARQGASWPLGRTSVPGTSPSETPLSSHEGGGGGTTTTTTMASASTSLPQRPQGHRGRAWVWLSHPRPQECPARGRRSGSPAE